MPMPRGKGSPSGFRRSTASSRSGFGPPKLTPLTSSTMDVLKLGLVSDVVDPYSHARRRRLDDQAAAAGRARHRARHRLWRRDPAGADPAEARPARGSRPHRHRRDDGRERSHRAARRRRRRDDVAAHHDRNAAALARSARHFRDRRDDAERPAGQARRRRDRHDRARCKNRRRDDHGPARRVDHGLGPVRRQHARSDEGDGSSARGARSSAWSAAASRSIRRCIAPRRSSCAP